MTGDTHSAIRPPIPRATRESLVYLLAILAFLVSTTLAVWFCRSMSEGMEMPGGWSMSMMWMPMPGQGWLAAAGMFLAMWLAMMVAMMLPSVLPTIVIYRRVLQLRHEPQIGLATSFMALGYFLVWLAFGAAAFALGVVAASGAMRWEAASRAVPALSGLILIICGLFQFTKWKMSCLRHCRDPLHFVATHLEGVPVRRRCAGSWRFGVHHGALCAGCCWGLMLAQLVLGMMNLTLMAVLAAVIALEKLAPRGIWIARAAGAASITGGFLLIGRATLTAATQVR